MNASMAIKSLRGKKLLTQEEVANRLGVIRQTYNTYESNPLKLELNVIINILNALEATVEEREEFFNALKQDFMSCKGDD